jgi:hypothetical protein
VLATGAGAWASAWVQATSRMAAMVIGMEWRARIAVFLIRGAAECHPFTTGLRGENTPGCLMRRIIQQEAVFV